MVPLPLLRWLRLVPGLALVLPLALALAGCDSAGFSAREAELERLRGERGFAVMEESASRAVFAAEGRRIAVEPPEGYCLDEESVSVTRRSAFVLVADCMHDQEVALANGAGVDALPRAFPGILTITISSEAGLGGEEGALPAFEALLDSAAGGRLLGRGEGTAPGEIIAMRRIDGALYVLIEEPMGEGGESILAPRFWRAFTQVNGRLVLVTVSGFNDRPLGEDEMLTFLAAQMAKLREANGQPASYDEQQIAAAVLEELDAGAAEAPEAETVAARGPGAPAAAPVAPPRPG